MNDQDNHALEGVDMTICKLERYYGVIEKREEVNNVVCSASAVTSTSTLDSVVEIGVTKLKNRWNLQVVHEEDPRKQRLLMMDAEAMTNLWLAQLCSFPCVNREKAVAISTIFEGPKELFDAYRGCDSEMGRTLLADIEYTVILGSFTRTDKVGSVVSEIIYDLFTTPLQDDLIPEVE